ncbi:FAD:protein FMN transferase [Cellulomonas edaphi]|uniref:FAD:protein FMN transferase n=1 Tax=Cellulomonas edaphi TaxID=3053468 RepID=A0ABT7SBZ4_9CELL|nr:FAD:protein FMN transferase [Cellulomons edaphi]MDM7832522.1 FAD:protein FMN transferase [Cellulomons edaphi]
MGIPMSLDVRGADRPQAWAAVTEAFELLHAADRRFDRRRPDSEVSRYGRGEVPPALISDELREVLALAERTTDASGGAFSVRAPDGSLDTDGVVKGWAAQRAADVLRAAGLTRFCLNAGGDVATAGEPEQGRGWNVAVRDPADAQRFLAILEVRDGGVATSGTYERGGHVWDGRTGATAAGLVSATVVAADLVTADLLATSVLALGPDGIAWASAHGAAAVIAVRPDGQVLTDRAGASLLGTSV